MSDKVIVSKSKLTNLADKVRAKAETSVQYSIDEMAEAVENLQLGVDENSIYEELNSMEFGSEVGYTLTLLQGSATDYKGAITTNNYAEYSLDNGKTWLKFYGLTLPIVLENVSTIQFRTTDIYGTTGEFAIGATSTSTDVGILYLGNSLSYELTADTTLYIGGYSGSHSGGAG